MADVDNVKETKEFYLDIPAKNQAFFLKGSGALDWGMQNRLARIFSPSSGRTVMLAIDHGYFQGPTTGLERVDVNILPLLPYTNALMLTRGILRAIVPSSFTSGVVLRASGGPSILKGSRTSSSRWILKMPRGSIFRRWPCRCLSAVSSKPRRSTT